MTHHILAGVHSVSYHSSWEDFNVQTLEYVRTHDDDPLTILQAALREELNGALPADLGVENAELTEVVIDGEPVFLDTQRAMGF